MNAPNFIEADDVQASAFSTTTAKEAAYAFIQEKISSFEAIVRFWKQRHNALSVVSRLPHELLAAIFKFAEAESTHLCWLSLTHVCSHWRRVALDNPNLWSNIPVTNISWATEMIKRSKMAPLTVTLDDYCEILSHHKVLAVREVLLQVVAQLFRVKKLTLNYWGGELFREFISLLDSPAPVLESLEIFGDGNPLRNRLLSGAQRLLHLRLSGCGIAWQELASVNLKSLWVSNTSEFMCPSVEKFISALSRMPFLETVEFCSPFALTNDAYPPLDHIANLSHLRYLHIECELTHCVSLLNHLTYPANTRIQIKCTAQGFDEDSAPSFSPIRRFSEKIASGIQGPIRSLAVKKNQIKCWGSPKVDLVNPQFPPTVDIEIDVRCISAQLTKELWKPFSLNQVSSLMVTGVDFGKKTWLNQFGRFSQLKNLRVDCNEVALLNALSHGLHHAAASSPSDKPAPTGNPRFKALRNLTLIKWDFFDGETSLMEPLNECLAARREAGLRLRYLELKECLHVEEEDVECLEDVVKTVEWEEYEIDSDE